MQVDPATFEATIREGPGEEESSSSDQGEQCDWEASTEEEAEVVQAISAKAEIIEDPVTKMEVEEEPAPPRRAKERKKKVEEGSEARIAPGPPDVNQDMDLCAHRLGSFSEANSALPLLELCGLLLWSHTAAMADGSGRLQRFGLR